MTTYTYTDLIDPSAGPNGVTSPVSINDRGQVTGYYYNGTTDVGFLYSNGTWTNLSDPSAGPKGFTEPASINDLGQVTGNYGNGTTSAGFLYSNGTWTTLSDPSAASGRPTFAHSINDRGQVIGQYNNGTSDVGFLYSNGTYTTLSDPSAASGGSTFALSINDRGQVTGQYGNIGGQILGFLYSNGTYTTLSDPSAASGGSTFAYSINDRGQVTGTYYNGTTDVGFLYSNGTWTNLSDPSEGANGAIFPIYINDRGQVIGTYSNGTTQVGSQVGFLYSNGTWTTLIDPSASPNESTNPVSINDRGQIVGSFGTHNASLPVPRGGFIATPTDDDHKREPPKLTITDHSLSLTAGGSVVLPISVTAKDADDTVSVKISGVPSYDTITAGDGHVVAKKGNSYTFTAADVQSGLTLTSSFDNHAGHEGRHGEHDEHRSEAEQSKLTVTAVNTTHGESAAAPSQTVTVTNTPNDLSYLTKLLNELQPAFLELTTSHGPSGSPTIFMETYTKQHITLEMPPIEVTAPNNDPTTVTFSGVPSDFYVGSGMNVSGPTTMPSTTIEGRQFYPPPGSGHGAFQLAITPITVTATDTVTGISSAPVTFNFLGYGRDPTLPPETAAPPTPAQAVEENLYTAAIDTNPGPGMSYQSLAALINQYAAAGLHNEHVSAGQMTSSPDKQGHQANLAFLSNPHH